MNANYVHVECKIKCGGCVCEYCPNCFNGCPRCKRGEIDGTIGGVLMCTCPKKPQEDATQEKPTWEENYRKMMSLTVRANNHSDELRAFLLQKQTDMWWNETFIDPTVSFISQAIATAIKAERERLWTEGKKLKRVFIEENPNDIKDKETYGYNLGIENLLDIINKP